MAAGRDEWRVEVSLDDEQHGYALAERLRSLTIDDEARARLGRDVVVTSEGPVVHLYAESLEAVREAERLVRELLVAEELPASVELTRWHPVEGAWRPPGEPLPTGAAARAEEQERHLAAEREEALAEGEYDWAVRAHLPERTDAEALGARLEAEGIDVRRRGHWVLIGALTEERADELAAALRRDLPTGSEVHAEANVSSLPSPLVVLAGATLDRLRGADRPGRG